MNRHRQLTLDERNIPGHPITLFKRWYREAGRNGILLPNAMALATVSPAGLPSVRVVLLKSVDKGAFVFYTNFRSRKGRELQKNRHAELMFWWPSLERQVRIEGKVEKVPSAEADNYFRSRPRGSQIGAHASPQSEAIRDREWLELRAAEIAEQYRGKEIPRPAHWGGFRVRPSKIEFWQGRKARLHDRILYTRTAAGNWVTQRLAP